VAVIQGRAPQPDPEDIAGRVNDLCELSGEDSKLSDWEIDFVDSVAKQIDLCRIVSAAQKSKVLELHRKHCGGG
jgi:hypothetical protein